MDQTPYASLIEMFMHPVFLVENGIIINANQYALDHQITVGSNVQEFIVSGLEEYKNFGGVCLSLTVRFCDCDYVASVSRQDQLDIFQIPSGYDNNDLKTVALAAKQLRGPLANAMVSADRLFPNPALQSDKSAQKQIGQINRNLYQLLRTVNNMADASSEISSISGAEQTLDIVAIFHETIHRMTEMVASTKRTLVYKEPHQSVYCLINQRMVERAIYNLVSNAVKFSPEGSKIIASLTKKGEKLLFTVENQCEDLNSENIRSIFNRYQRQPALEDSRYGLGLGMRIVQNAASIHGGTLLLEQPEKDMIRFTMTISLKKGQNVVRTPSVTILSGGYDDCLIELSEILPETYFTNIN